MMLKRGASGYFVEIKDGPRVSRHKPSVDVLFRSCANESPRSCTAGLQRARSRGIDRYYWPVAAALALLVVEALMGTRREKFNS